MRQTLKEKWSYDISDKPISYGEIYDEDVIKQSIKAIISTMFYERLFNHTIGSAAGTTPFTNMTESGGEAFLDSIINSIQNQENRVIILKNSCNIVIFRDQNSCLLTISYILKRTNTPSKFVTKLIF
jgi:hypothetical protein